MCSIQCPKCEGSGYKCWMCHGRGEVDQPYCGECGGSKWGLTFRDRLFCHSCRKEGRFMQPANMLGGTPEQIARELTRKEREEAIAWNDANERAPDGGPMP